MSLLGRVIAAFAGACLCVDSLRKGRSGSWSTKTDGNRGPCAAYMDASPENKLPVHIPLWCDGDASGLTFRAKATGNLNGKLLLHIDNIAKGSRTFPIFGGTRDWAVSHDSLSAGLHIVQYSKDWFTDMALHEVEVSGSGGTCSFDTVAGYDPTSYTNTGMDVITRVLGPEGSTFSEVAKRGIYFSSQVMGITDDDSISATVLNEGMWEWFYQYSKEQTPGDEWGAKGKMYDESDIKPWPNVSLDQFPGRFGEEMVVQEPCNTVSNIVYSEASVWLSCKGLSFSQEDRATVLGVFHTMGAGSTFMHASGTRTGQMGDVAPIKVLMLQMHQIMAKSLLDRATGLTQAERDAILYLRRSGLATDHARTLTSLFRGQYSRTKWDSVVSDLDLPAYELSIAASVLTVVEALDGNYPIPGLGAAVNGLVEYLLSALGGSDIEWVASAYRPAIRKVFASVSLCGDAANGLLGSMIAFALTFAEAFIYQEEVVPFPPDAREFFRQLQEMGYTSGAFSDMVETWDMYNGERDMCRSRSDHAQWHHLSAHGLVHMANVAEYILTRTNC